MQQSALFVLDTPAQVFNLKEALREYSIDDYDVIVHDCCRADAYPQLLLLLEELAPRKLIQVPRQTGEIELRISCYGQHVSALSKESYSLVFFTNVRQQWQRDVVCSLSGSKVVLMDDGNATLVFYRYLFSKQQFFDFPADPDAQRAQRAAQCRQELGISTIAPERLELFTVFELPELPWLSVRKNVLSAMQYHHQSVNRQQMLLLGGGEVELGFINVSEYLLLLNNVRWLYPELEIIFLPHRTATTELLEYVREIPGVSVLQTGVPVETWLSQTSVPPFLVCGFYSMALTTISLCFNALEVVVLRPPLHVWHAAEKTHVWNLTRCNNLQMIETVVDYLSVAKGLKVTPLTVTQALTDGKSSVSC